MFVLVRDSLELVELMHQFIVFGVATKSFETSLLPFLSQLFNRIFHTGGLNVMPGPALWHVVGLSRIAKVMMIVSLIDIVC